MISGRIAKVRLAVVFIGSFILSAPFSSAYAHSGHEHVTPYLPPGVKIAKVSLPKGQDPNPNAFSKEKGKVTVAFFFKMEEGVRPNLKAFLTNPQDASLHWEMKEIPAAKVASAKVPIMGDLDTGKGQITGPLVLAPARKMYLITLVVDNRKGKEDQIFYLPAPNPNTDFILSSDTKSEILFKMVPLCLCGSQVYTAPKGGIWYRVIALYLAPDAPTPARVAVMMTIMKAPRALAH